jgi:hypothetical protein
VTVYFEIPLKLIIMTIKLTLHWVFLNDM